MWQRCYRLVKVPIDVTHHDQVDLRTVLQKGTYALEGIQNKIYEEGGCMVDKWGDELPGPEENDENEWRHVVCIKDGMLLDWECDQTGARFADGGKHTLDVLWLNGPNSFDVKKSYFRKVLKVYAITRA